MWNLVRDGDVENLVDNFDVKSGGERWCEIWWITLTWNAPENGYVRYGG